jgi:hypothetical protein
MSMSALRRPGRMLVTTERTHYHYLALLVGTELEESMEARHQRGIGLSYRPARLHRLAEFIPWNRSLGSIND